MSGTIAGLRTEPHNSLMSSPAVDPKQDPSRRRWRLPLRFSLRTFLIAITIFCIVLGWRLHRARLQRDAVAGIQARGGRVGYDYQFDGPEDHLPDPKAKPWEPKWLQSLVGIDFFHDVFEIDTIGATMRVGFFLTEREKNIVAFLRYFPRLRQLHVSDGHLDNDGTVVVARLKHLDFLSLNSTVNDDGVAHLRGMRSLKNLCLDHSCGDGSLATAAKIPNLRFLILLSDRVTDRGLGELAGHPKIESLVLGGENAQITDAGVAKLAQISTLESLSLAGPKITIDGLKPLQKLPKLKELHIPFGPANDYDRLAPLFPKCKVIADKKTPPPALAPAPTPSANPFGP